MVSEKKIFFSFSHYKSMGANDPWGVASLGLRVLIGRINVGDHLTLLHIKYVSGGPHGFREDFLSFSHYNSKGANDLQAVASLNPRGLTGRTSVQGDL